MAVKACGKFNKMFSVMTKQKFKANFPDQLLCRKCNNILINACQAGCGCRYCRHCIDELVASGCQICPGGTTDCKDETLADVATDHIVNKTISKCVVECPNESCQHECQLIDMVEHLESCLKTSAKCLFHNYGCHADHLRGDRSGDDLRTEISSHNLILIEMIGCVKNELEMVKHAAKLNEEKLSEEIRLIKMEKEELVKQVKHLKMNITNKSEGSMINTESSNWRMDLIEIQHAELVQEIDILRIDSSTSQQFRNNLERRVTEINDENKKSKVELVAKLNESEKWLEKIIDGIFLWKIDEISEKRVDGCSIYSSIFSSTNEYSIRLELEMTANSNDIAVYFHVYPGYNDSRIQWPFNATVAITITNRASPGGWKCVTKHLKINNPKQKSASNNKFKFRFSDLSRYRLVHGNSFIIECSFD